MNAQIVLWIAGLMATAGAGAFAAPHVEHAYWEWKGESCEGRWEGSVDASDPIVIGAGRKLECHETNATHERR